MIVKMDRPRGASGAPTVCARQGCENPVLPPPGGGPRRRYCSDGCRSADRRERHSRADADPGGIVPFSVVQEEGEAGPVAELRALSARLAQLADAVDSALVDAEVDAVAARVASLEAVAAEHVAERQAADERQAGLAAEEAAEVAEDLASAASRDRDAALADAAERVKRADAQAAQVRADADARIAAEHSARVAAQSHADALAGERDRLAAQLAAQADRDAASLAALARAVEAAEERATTLSAELAALRRAAANPDVPTVEIEGTARSRTRRRSVASEEESRVHRPAG
jgi:hypothetical protein